MRKLKLLQLVSLSLVANYAFAQDILWEKSYGGKYPEYLTDAVPTSDYGFILAGSSLSNKSGNKSDNNKGDLDYWVWKMNENGDLDWQKSFGGSESDLLQSIALTNDGGFILAGVSSSNKSIDKKEDSRGMDDFWIIKLNAKGSEEWQVTIGGSFQEKLHSIKPTRDGGYIIGGSSYSEKSIATIDENGQTKGEKSTESFGNIDYWVVKIDNNGKIQWQKSFGGRYVDELRSIDTTTDGGYILGGYSNSPASGNKSNDNIGIGDYWVIKLDEKGNEQWQKTIGGNKDDQLGVVHQTYDKGYVLAGSSNSDTGEFKTKNNGEGTDFWVVKLDETGAIIWQETFNYGKFDILTSLVENPDHSLLIGGYAKGEITGNGKVGLGKPKAKKGTDDFIALKLSEKGEELWGEIVGSNGQDVLRKVVETRDGGYLLAGTASPISSLYNTSKGNSNTTKSGFGLGQGNNETVDSTVQELNSEVKNYTDDLNKEIDNTTGQVTNTVRETLGLSDDSPLRLGNNPSTNGVGLKPSSGGNNNGLAGLGNSKSNKQLPPSGDKKTNFGSHDFWVVKLRDKDKPKQEKATIEAYPNPTTEFTNVIVGYDYIDGTATIVDIAGRQLNQFEITGRTIPIDLSGLPEGIYIVNIKTDVQSDGVKVMKKGNKN